MSDVDLAKKQLESESSFGEKEELKNQKDSEFNKFLELKNRIVEYKGRFEDNFEEWQRYILINKFNPESYVTYDKLDISWSSMDKYQLIRHIGRGKYGEVFLGKIEPLAKSENFSPNFVSDDSDQNNSEFDNSNSKKLFDSDDFRNNQQITLKERANRSDLFNAYDNNNRIAASNAKISEKITSRGINKLSKYPSKQFHMSQFSHASNINPKTFLPTQHSTTNNSTSDRVIKILKSVRYLRLQREVKILMTLGDHPNIIKLLDVIRDKVYNYYAYVFEYIKSESHHHSFSKFNLFDIQNYIYQVLLGLDHIHSLGIMHRDIKPQNIMYNQKTRELKIIDFGLAEYYIPGKDNAIRVASKYYKGPELFLEFTKYDYALDIWALGCVFASIIFMKEPFFAGSDNRDMVAKMVGALGYDEFIVYLTKYKINQDPAFINLVKGNKSQRWQIFFNTKYIDRVCKESIDLLDSMLVFDHHCRTSTRQALRHPYFTSIRCIYGENF